VGPRPIHAVQTHRFDGSTVRTDRLFGCSYGYRPQLDLDANDDGQNRAIRTIRPTDSSSRADEVTAQTHHFAGSTVRPDRLFGCSYGYRPQLDLGANDDDRNRAIRTIRATDSSSRADEVTAHTLPTTDHAPRTTPHAPRTTHHAPRTTHHALRPTHYAPTTSIASAGATSTACGTPASIRRPSKTNPARQLK